jgi:hypothetical protein
MTTRAINRRNTRQRALARLVELFDDPDPRVAFMASREVLDRAYGKPAPATEVDEDKKLTVVIRHFEAEVLPAPPRRREP